MEQRQQQGCRLRLLRSAIAGVLGVQVLLLAIQAPAQQNGEPGVVKKMTDHIQKGHLHTPDAKAARVKPNAFIGLTTEGKGSFTLPFPVERVFPLYGPVEEAKWAADWSPTWVFPDQKTATDSRPKRGWTWFTSADDAHNARTWQVEEFDAEKYRVVYHVFFPQKAVYRIEINAKAEGSGTKTDVHYELVGLSEQGNQFVKHRVENFDKEMEHWKALIEYYLRVGESHPPL
jgi:hypothetical protein